jgi:hypothetical protein
VSAADEARAGTMNRVRAISEALVAIGFSGHDARIGAILGVDAVTVWRWRTGEVTPRGKTALSLAILARVANHFSDVPKGQKKLRAELLEKLAQDSGNLQPEFCPFRGYESALNLIGWDVLIPNRCEWDFNGATLVPTVKKRKKARAR